MNFGPFFVALPLAVVPPFTNTPRAGDGPQKDGRNAHAQHEDAGAAASQLASMTYWKRGRSALNNSRRHRLGL